MVRSTMGTLNDVFRLTEPGLWAYKCTPVCGTRVPRARGKYDPKGFDGIITNSEKESHTL
jgi:hypothetical protein